MIQTTVAESRFDTSHEVVAPAIDVVATTRLTWWGPVLAGTVAAIATQVIFAVLGTAIGLTIIGTAADDPGAGLAMGAGIYWFITGLASLFIGGWVAGWACPIRHRFIGALHGFLTWCTVTVVSLWFLMMTGGAALGGTLNMMGTAMGGTTQVTTTTGMESAATNEPQAGAQAPAGNQPVLTEAERDAAAESSAIAAWWTLAALILGACVAAVGGLAGVRSDVQLFGERRGRTTGRPATT